MNEIICFVFIPGSGVSVNGGSGVLDLHTSKRRRVGESAIDTGRAESHIDTDDLMRRHQMLVQVRADFGYANIFTYTFTYFVKIIT